MPTADAISKPGASPSGSRPTADASRADGPESNLLASLMKEFVCPITLEVMRDPVQTCASKTYDRSAIENWFRQGKQTDPVTGQALHNTSLLPNLALRGVYEAVAAARPELALPPLHGLNDHAQDLVETPAVRQPAPISRPAALQPPVQRRRVRQTAIPAPVRAAPQAATIV